MTTGAELISKALADQGISFCYGIVGIPVIELGYALQGAGIKYYGFRHEQGAAYAAGMVGYLTKTPGLCLTVPGPGMTNAISGLLNSFHNSWPMILLSGSSDLDQTEMGGFQEVDQVLAAKPYVKLAVRVTKFSQIPFLVEKAVRVSLSGRPGPVYIDVPADILNGKFEGELSSLPKFLSAPISVPPANEMMQAMKLMSESKKPLIIIGKGAAYSGATDELTQLINSTGIPFLPTPMGKGVVSDYHQLCSSPARSHVLKNSDLIILVGAKLNWILHFGKPPRFLPNVKMIQMDICPEEMGNNLQANVKLQGDIKETVNLLNEMISKNHYPSFYRSFLAWTFELEKKIEKNSLSLQSLMTKQEDEKLNYYTAYNEDIGRTILKHKHPKRRLDAGTLGTMGIGLPFCIAAKSVSPSSRVIAIMGDSAFGFTAMEAELLTRYNLPVTILIINNNGIFQGVEEMPGDNEDIALNLPPTGLNVDTKYGKIGEAFGGKGYEVENREKLAEVLDKVFADDVICFEVNDRNPFQS